jgi:hypothetical protein
MAALGRLRDLTVEPLEQGRWRHWVVGVDAIHRITLPAGARPTGEPQGLSAVTSG